MNEQQITSYGVYIKSADGYVALRTFERDARYVEHKYLNELPVVLRENKELELVIFQKDFSVDSVWFELRSMDVTACNRQISMIVTPMEKADVYRLTYDRPVDDGEILHVFNFGWYHTGLAAVCLGDPRELLPGLLNTTEAPAYAVLPTVEDLIQAFPDCGVFRELQAVWECKYRDEKDENDYKYVEQKWRAYEEAEKLASKAHHLRHMLIEINGYLDQHPKGKYAGEARRKQQIAEAKLLEYDKLI